MDNLDSHVEIELGIPEELRPQAAIICYEGFPQLRRLLGSQQNAVKVFESSFNTELGLSAQSQGQLVGFIGLKYENCPFFRFERSHCIRALGLLRGLLTFLLLNNNMSVAKPLPDEMYIDVLVVDASMRGKGIGSLLIQGAFEIAQQNQCSAVVLEVVNANPDARRFYERLGFKAVRTIELKYLPKWIGTGATFMRKELISA
jgi:ribosomal protein S18 acetylase RimI-like enzyme